MMVGFLTMAVIAGPRAMLRGQLGAAPDTNDVAAPASIAAMMAWKVETNGGGISHHRAGRWMTTTRRAITARL